MRKFKFRLEPYLGFCRHLETAEQLRLAEVLGDYSRIQDALRSLVAALERTEAEFSGQRQILVYEAGWYLHRISSLKTDLERLEHRLEEAAERVREQRRQLVEARRKRKIVERLRERRLESHEREVERLHQSEMDDLFLQRFNRT